MANEFFKAFGPDASVTISPRGQGVMEVFVDGERIFDKKGEGEIFPDLKRVRAMTKFISEKIDSFQPAPAD
jgi:predicted Rdx family selenoprotein